MRLFLASLLLGATALASITPAAADGSGLDWQPVPLESSKVLLDLPGTGEKAVFLTASNPAFTSKFHVARYKTDKFRLDRAMLVYLELEPGYHFRSARSTDRVLQWKALQSADIDLGPKIQIANDRGTLDVQRFRLEDRVECAALAQTWGQSGSEGTSAGTDQLLGYLCEEDGAEVTQQRIEMVAQAIYVRD